MLCCPTYSWLNRTPVCLTNSNAWWALPKYVQCISGFVEVIRALAWCVMRGKGWFEQYISVCLPWTAPANASGGHCQCEGARMYATNLLNSNILSSADRCTPFTGYTVRTIHKQKKVMKWLAYWLFVSQFYSIFKTFHPPWLYLCIRLSCIDF